MARWRELIRNIEDGQPVDAGNTNRPITDVQGNVAYLKSLFDAAELGTALFAREVGLEEECLVGYAVYWDAGNQRFARAKAAATVSNDTGVELADTAQVVGIVYAKDTATSGTVLLLGYAEVDIAAAAAVDTPEAGFYFLSGVTAGGLTLQQPPVGIGVLFYDGHGKVLVNPQPRNFLEGHRHYRIELFARPAGTVTEPAQGDPHTISAADSDLPGWLPADDASFAGNAPEGAKFGYNLAAHTELQELWPPIPLTAATVFVERPSLTYDVTANRLGATMLDSRMVVIDQNGIWWMSDEYNQAPWDTDYDSGNSLYGSSVSYDTTHSPEQIMRIWLCFALATYANNRNVVTSLTPAAGSPLLITNCNGDTSSVGDLNIDVDLDLLLNDTSNEAGSKVIKTLDGLTLLTGYVTEGLLAGSNVSLESSNQRDEGDETLHRGVVRINVDLEPTERELPPEVIKLEGALERTGDDIPYIGLPTGRASAVRLRYNVPPTGLPTNARFKLRLLLLGTTAGTFPALAATFKVLPNPANAAAARVDLGDLTEQDLTLTTTAASFLADNVMRRETSVAEIAEEEYAVQAGDTIYVTISRDDDAYAGEVGLVRMQCVIYAG